MCVVQIGRKEKYEALINMVSDPDKKVTPPTAFVSMFASAL